MCALQVLIPTSQFVRSLVAARLAADVSGVPTVLIARTDAHSANLLTSDVDERDMPFIHGERTPEGFYQFNGGIKVGGTAFSHPHIMIRAFLFFTVLPPLCPRHPLQASLRVSTIPMAVLRCAGLTSCPQWFFFSHMQQKALPRIGLCKLTSTAASLSSTYPLVCVNGWKGHRLFGGLETLLSVCCCSAQAAIARGLAYAPFADLLWVETSTPDLAEAKEFAEAIHAKFPGKMLAYNCSPSFNWRRHLDEATIASFQKVGS